MDKKIVLDNVIFNQIVKTENKPDKEINSIVQNERFSENNKGRLQKNSNNVFEIPNLVDNLFEEILVNFNEDLTLGL